MLVVCDSESYLKWAANLASQLPGVDADLVLLDTPIRPSPEQTGNAVAGTAWGDRPIPVLSGSALHRRLRSRAPELVLAAATGPVVAQVHDLASRLPRRPALISGLPGMGLPATGKAMQYRLLGDGFIVHSPVEAVAYAQRMRECRISPVILGTRLPMLHSPGLPLPRTEPITTVVFAAQAKVPATAPDRRAVLLALRDFARSDQGRRAVLKLRSRPGEQETHHERHSYLELLDDLIDAGQLGRGEIEIGLGPMVDFLLPGSALATISSTAALEAMDRGLPTLFVDDFGVGPDLLNEAFAGSGCLGSLADLASARIGHPHSEWLDVNYFQPRDEALLTGLLDLAERSRAGNLADPAPARRRMRRLLLRSRLRLLAPRPVVHWVQWWRGRRRTALG